MNAKLDTFTSSRNAFDLLRRIATRKIEAERCELCSFPIGETHQHLFELSARRIICACDACAVLFSNSERSKYKQIPRRARLLDDFQLTCAEWESLVIPIDLAYFFRRTTPATTSKSAGAGASVKDQTFESGSIAAFYPSPAGATECLLDLNAWDEIEKANPILKQMQPDIEALLVNRIKPAPDYYLAPIDECYKLVGLIRMHWRGLSGGTEVWQKIEQFFIELRKKCG